MIASLLLVGAVAFPALGTYTYEIDTPAGKTFRTTVAIARAADGIATHESFGVPSMATTDQRFDSSLHELTFNANQTGRSLTITFAQSQALYRIAGKTVSLALDAPDCLLVSDNILTSLVMLPSVVLATGAVDCTFVLSTAVQLEKGYVLDAPPKAHPTRAAPDDASVAIDVNGLHETIWYDRKTLIPDYIDFGETVGDAFLIR